jgi:hypothetical protein
MRYFILMYISPFGMMQISGTGHFDSRTAARNYIKYNGHLFADDKGMKIAADTVKIYEIIETV